MLSGGVEPPGDKSISHRYAMIAALAEGASELRHFAAAADCHSTLDCMKALDEQQINPSEKTVQAILAKAKTL